jgi:HEAT repeat protein
MEKRKQMAAELNRVYASLQRELRHGAAPSKLQAIRLIYRNRFPVEPLAASLIECVCDQNVEVRRLATALIVNCGCKSDLMLAALITALCDDDSYVVEFACDGIADYGVAAQPAIGQLVLCSEDVRLSVRQSAMKALEKIATHEAPKVLH